MAETSQVLRRNAPKIIASLIIAAFFVWMFRRGGLPLVPDQGVLSALTLWGTAGYVALLSLCTWLRTYRWIYLLRPIANVSPMRTVGIGLVGYAAIFFAPLRTGELVRPYLLSNDGEIGFTQAAGTVVAERVIDGLVVSLVLFAGLVFAHPVSPLPHHLGTIPIPLQAIPGAAYSALVMFGGAFTAMALFYFARDFARRLTHRVLGLVSEKLATWFTEKIERLADSLRFFASRDHGVPFVRDTALYWITSIFSFWVALRGCGIVATPAEVCLCLGVVGLGSLIPSGPGMFGTYQLASYAALSMFYPENVVLTAGAAVVFLTYTTQFVVTLIGAGIGYWLMRASDPGAPAAT